MTLYGYWRSTTTFRVRAALHLKRLSFDEVAVDLLSGDQHDVGYRTINPNGGVPSLKLADGVILTQSLAILDYLDSLAEPLLLPQDPVARAQVLAAAHTVAMDIHPVNNLRVGQYAQETLGASDAQMAEWMVHWINAGFSAFEQQILPDTRFCFGSAPDLADLCLVAQAYNAERWQVDLDAFPRISRAYRACLAHPAIQAAHPDKQANPGSIT